MLYGEKHLPEILGAVEQDGHYFAYIQLERNSQKKCFRIGVSQNGYLAIKRTLQLRPFDQMAGLTYRYYFTPAVQHNGEHVNVFVKIEQGNNIKQYEIKWPIDLAKNLMWFWELKDWAEAKHFEVDTPYEQPGESRT